MTDTLAYLQRQRQGAKELQSVVRSMKALAASSIGQYERSVRALADYSATVDLGLRISLRERTFVPVNHQKNGDSGEDTIRAVVFGSDQGLVGQFNERLAGYVAKTLSLLPGPCRIWAVGERMQARLADAGLPVQGIFPVPNSVKGITPLVGRILSDSDSGNSKNNGSALYLFHNRPESDLFYTPITQRLLPFDDMWRRRLVDLTWPTSQLPEVIGTGVGTLKALIREYLFVSLFRACAESLASENAGRLMAMQRAEKNIEELLDNLDGRYHRLRQSAIDEELFDVISGVEALSQRTP